MASAVLSISAEIAASRARLETVLARLEVAEKAALQRENNIRNHQQEVTRNNYYRGRKIQFEDSYEEQDHHQYYHFNHQAQIYTCMQIAYKQTSS